MSRSPRIQSLHVQLTTECNLRCAYCYQRGMTRGAVRGGTQGEARSAVRRGPRDTIPWLTLRRALDWALQSGRRDLEIIFSGGEPLLAWPLIRRAVAHVEAHAGAGGHVHSRTHSVERTHSNQRRQMDKRAHAGELPRSRRRPRFALLTNGLLLDDDKIAFLVQHAFSLQLSFDGIAALQDLRRRGSFEILDGLLRDLRVRHARYFRRHVSIAMTLVPDAVPSLAKSIGYFLRQGVRDIVITPTLTPVVARLPGPARPATSMPSRAQKATSAQSPDAARILATQVARVLHLSREHLARTGEVPVRNLRPALTGEGSALHRHPTQIVVFPARLEHLAAPIARRQCTQRPMCGVTRGVTPAVDVRGGIYGCGLLADVARTRLSRRWAPTLDALRIGDVADHDLDARLLAFRERARASGLFGRKESKHSSRGRCADCPSFATCEICPLVIVLAGQDDPACMPDFACAFAHAMDAMPRVESSDRRSEGRRDARPESHGRSARVEARRADGSQRTRQNERRAVDAPDRNRQK
jgi:sulfatase maturation enzyme AslB (radical SAM superfamily)